MCASSRNRDILLQNKHARTNRHARRVGIGRSPEQKGPVLGTTPLDLFHFTSTNQKVARSAVGDLVFLTYASTNTHTHARRCVCVFANGTALTTVLRHRRAARNVCSDAQRGTRAERRVLRARAPARAQVQRVPRRRVHYIHAQGLQARTARCVCC